MSKLSHVRISILEDILRERLPKIEKRKDMTDYQRGVADCVLDIHNALAAIEKKPPPNDPHALIRLVIHQSLAPPNP